MGGVKLFCKTLRVFGRSLSSIDDFLENLQPLCVLGCAGVHDGRHLAMEADFVGGRGLRVHHFISL